MDWQLSSVPQDWIDMAKKETKLSDPLNELTWQTPEGIGIKPLYTPADLEGLDIANEIPGKFPYTRGPYATMYTQKPWTIRQYAGGARQVPEFFSCVDAKGSV